MLETFNKKIQELLVGGFIDYFDQDYLKYIKPERYEHLHPKGPKVLTMEHLRAGFTVCCLSLSFAAFSFVFEWIKTLAAYVVSKYIVNTFYELKIKEIRRDFIFMLSQKIQKIQKDEDDLLSGNIEVAREECLEKLNNENDLECLSVTSEDFCYLDVDML